MERTKQIIEKVDGIFTGDWHIREDVPVCRVDDYLEEQWRKIRFVADLQRKYHCPVVHSGDLIDYWKSSPELITRMLEELPDDFYTVFGNHDLPQHLIPLARKSGVMSLVTAGKVKLLNGTHWGQKFTDVSLTIKNRTIAVWHVYTWEGKVPWPGCISPSGNKILKDYNSFDVILTGDNHKPFQAQNRAGGLLLNPGSLMRMTADQINYKPAVWLYNAETNSVKPKYLPINENAVTREHIEGRQERDDRIDAFVTRLNDEWEIDLDFEENLKRFAEVNQVRSSVMDIIYKSLEV